MKDSMKSCEHCAPDDAVYKEVVVVGNGPSGLVSSFMLAGNVPHLKEIPENLPIDEMLKARLSNLPVGQSLYETDLVSLAEGLEGRSQNPMPLLMDVLLRPCADLGLQEDPLIEWRYDADKKIDHIVLGRGPAGGSWHTFPAGVRTLSPGQWLSLPPHATVGAGRVPASAVAAYCRRYVKQCHLQRYFLSGVVVTCVRPFSPPLAPCSRGCPNNARWTVIGYSVVTGEVMRWVCASAVLSVGGADRPNTLGAVPFAVLRRDKVDAAIKVLAERRDASPILIVGSGVSAADAVSRSRGAGLTAAHLHRDPAPALGALAPKQYPDYYQVYKMMCDGPSAKYDNYIPYPEHVIVKVTELEPGTADKRTADPDIEEAIRPKKVKLLNVVTNEVIVKTVSLIAVLIGSKPDLFFLPNYDLNCVELNNPCSKCEREKKRKIDDNRQCFFKNHWHYIKTMLGQSIQGCKSRFAPEINGNTDKKCMLTECNNFDECTCNNNLTDDTIKCDCPTYKGSVKQCKCKEQNPFSNGIGFGVDPSKPIDCRANPIAVDKTTHEVLNSPKGLYALGPLTSDNFIRFIPGGALAIVADLHKKLNENEP